MDGTRRLQDVTTVKLDDRGITMPGAPEGNMNAIRHGADSDKVALPADFQSIVDGWIAKALTFSHIDVDRDIALIKLAGHKLKRILKIFAYEDAHPDQVTFKHDQWIISLENSFRLDLERLSLTPLTHHQIKVLLTDKNELESAMEVSFKNENTN